MSFESLNLPDHLNRAIEGLGFTEPTPIQLAAIPLVAAGKDVAAEAQTGSGKTAAFVLPILANLAPRPTALRVLTLVPTRELALQVAAAFKLMGRHASPPPRVLAVIGGEDIVAQISALSRGVDIIVATPGRLLDLVASGQIDWRDLTTLVIDEADKLLDLGFAEELSALVQTFPKERQTLFFSATLPPRVLTLTNSLMKDPQIVRTHSRQTPVETILQHVYEVDRVKRRPLFQYFLTTEDLGQTLVFVATQRTTENLAAKLRRDNFSAGSLHGGLDQAQRIKVLKDFKKGRITILVATDLAARGIDIPQLSTVINWDLPRSPRDYIHRIGRTGRAGEKGLAISFIDHENARHFKLIEKHAQIDLERESVEGFELSGEAPRKTKGQGGVKGHRKSKKDKLREAAARKK